MLFQTQISPPKKKPEARSPWFSRSKRLGFTTLPGNLHAFQHKISPAPKNKLEHNGFYDAKDLEQIYFQEISMLFNTKCPPPAQKLKTLFLRSEGIGANILPENLNVKAHSNMWTPPGHGTGTSSTGCAMA